MVSTQSLEEFVTKSRELISKEREAEIEETKLLQENVSPKVLEHRGVCVLRLRIGNRSVGLYGRTVLTLEPQKEMPSHNLTPGDIVGLSLSQGDSFQKVIASGVISRVTPSAINIAFDDSQDIFDLDDSTQYRIIKLANDVTYRRLQKTLDRLEEGAGDGHLKNVLFGVTEPGPPIKHQKELAFLNQNLDESQKEAVQFALEQPEVAIIHGPPGTGKTTTVTEIILQAVKSGLKVLASAPSNIAVDNLVERLAVSKVKLVRLGHPARLLPTIQSHSLDAILASSEETQLVEDVRTDISKSLNSLRKVRNKGKRQNLRQEIKQLRKELRQREEAAVKEIFKKSQVVLATLTMTSEDGPLGAVDKHHFDLVVIDECSQALEAACWIALLRSKRCVLAGDHNQLPPTILSQEAAKGGLEVTLMERLVKSHKDRIVRMLTMQYRMHESIMAWSSQQMYEGKLVAHPSVASHLLRDLPTVQESSETDIPLLLIDTAGCDLSELSLSDGMSKGNEGEADVTVAHVEKLLSAGLAPMDIAVIAPYNLQVELLRLRLAVKYPKLEIKSVDGFQGREKEAVVISLVRSNDKGDVGFLAEDRRINVAVTRARRHLAVVCDSETVSHHAFLKSLIDHLTQFGEVRSAQEYIQDGALNLDIRRPDHIESQLKAPTSKSTSSTDKRNNLQKSRPGQKGTAVSKRPEAGKKTEKVPNQDGTEHDSKEANDLREEELRKELISFTENDTSTVYCFPTSLTSHDRYLVHEIAEELGLLHLSKGEGSERCIEVRKLPKHSGSDPHRLEETKPKATTAAVASSDSLPSANSHSLGNSFTLLQTDADQTDQSGVDEKAPCTENAGSLTQCHLCMKKVPSSNIDLHLLHCQSAPGSRSGAVPKVPSRESSKKEIKVKPSKSLQQKASSNDQPIEEDFDSIIAAAMKENKTCHMHKCKNSTATLGQDCAFCRQRFCLSHHIPEVHGCGDKAKQHARTVLSQEGVLYRGSGVPSKKPDQVKRAHLERKLDRKLGELADKRKPKPKEK